MTISISVTALASEPPADYEKPVILKQGERAPFTGDLFHQYTTRRLNDDAENFQKCLSAKAECEDASIGLENQVDSAQFMSFLAGVGAGGFLVWMVGALVRK